MAQEGMVEVTGGSLDYRLSGTPGKGPVLVFENGWAASWHMWGWVERMLESQAQLLFYSRAGIGASKLSAPQTAAGLSRQLAELLAALKIDRPVIVVGQSYGGLMCALHAAQIPQLVESVVLVDATPPDSDPVVDKQLGAIKGIARLMILCARLGFALPMFAAAGKNLPQPAGSLMVRQSFGSASSLRAALGEMEVLGDIRKAIAAVDHGQRRLVISSSKATEMKGLAARLMASSEKARELIGIMQKQHKLYCSRSRQGQWMELPHTHGDLVFTEAGSADVAVSIRAFLGSRT